MIYKIEAGIDQRQVALPVGPFCFFFTLVVDFGKLRRTCQVIQNSKFFQVIFKQPRTEDVNKQRTKQWQKHQQEN